jgi:hypothetical protein
VYILTSGRKPIHVRGSVLLLSLGNYVGWSVLLLSLGISSLRSIRLLLSVLERAASAKKKQRPIGAEEPHTKLAKSLVNIRARNAVE